MNPVPYITAFAWVSITALTFAVFSNFWIPMLVGALVLALVVKLVR